MTSKIYKYYLTYLVITLLLFLIGPIDYQEADKVLVILFMLVFLACSTWAFWLGSKKRIRIRRLAFSIGKLRLELNEIGFIKFSLVIAFLVQWFVIISNVSVYGISLSSFQINRFFSQMAETYQDTEFISTSALVLMSYVGVTKIVAMVGGLFYLDKLQIKYRLLLLGIVIGIVINVTLFVGSQKQLVDLFVYLFVPLFLRVQMSGRKIKMSRKAAFIIAIVAVALMLGNNIATRFELVNTRYNTSTNISTGTINFDHPMFFVFPGAIGFMLTQLISYVSQGYRGLSLCLQLPFQWAYGLGSSFAMMNDFSRWFNIPIDVLEVSYPVRMQSQFGIRAYAYWHTIFPWIASDYTWVGAIIVVSLFIYFWAKAIKEFSVLKNLPALLMFVQLTIFVLYIPCNNQLFQTRESIVSTLVIAILWFFFHGEVRVRKGRQS